MNTLGGVSVDELKRVGFSNSDIEYMLEISSLYLAKISEPGKVTTTHKPASVLTIAHNAFQAGLACGLAKGKKLTRAEKKFGFT
jgi:hypothetical protein